MQVEQFYTGCLAEAAYYIESNGDVAIIDPLRETEPYMKRAELDGAKIRYVLETHFHADFVSGHLDLARKTGATIVYGPTAEPNFEAHVAEDGEELLLGDVRIKVLHTPGHTMESTTYLLFDEHGAQHAIFTGDTLFIGDVGRPDLAVTTDLSREDLAGFLFDSLRTKLFPLADGTIVYPGHGAGSACGKKMSDARSATLGNQKELNYALRHDMTREEFITEVTDGLMPPPQYFPKNAALNRLGYESVDVAMAKGKTALDVEAFAAAAEDQRPLILDTRSRFEVPHGYVPGSIFIGLDGDFAPWVGGADSRSRSADSLCQRARARGGSRSTSRASRIRQRTGLPPRRLRCMEACASRDRHNRRDYRRGVCRSPLRSGPDICRRSEGFRVRGTARTGCRKHSVRGDQSVYGQLGPRDYVLALLPGRIPVVDHGDHLEGEGVRQRGARPRWLRRDHPDDCTSLRRHGKTNGALTPLAPPPTT